MTDFVACERTERLSPKKKKKERTERPEKPPGPIVCPRPTGVNVGNKRLRYC